MSARTGRIIEAVGQGGLIVLELLVVSVDAFPPLNSAAGGTRFRAEQERILVERQRIQDNVSMEHQLY